MGEPGNSLGCYPELAAQTEYGIEDREDYMEDSFAANTIKTNTMNNMDIDDSSASSTEENTSAESVSEYSRSLNLNGEAWKNRNASTYISLLDLYGAEKLFSNTTMNAYREQKQEQIAKQERMTDYLLFEQQQDINTDEYLVEHIFSEEIQLSKIKDYNRNENNNDIYYVLIEIIFVFLFLIILIRIDLARRKRRRTNAVEINMEDQEPF